MNITRVPLLDGLSFELMPGPRWPGPSTELFELTATRSAAAFASEDATVSGPPQPGAVRPRPRPALARRGAPDTLVAAAAAPANAANAHDRGGYGAFAGAAPSRVDGPLRKVAVPNSFVQVPVRDVRRFVGRAARAAQPLRGTLIPPQYPYSVFVHTMYEPRLSSPRSPSTQPCMR
jgi:hypothetical protein